MRSLSEFRTGKPGFYPDQSVYAEFACAEFGLQFRDLDGGAGLLFSVASRDHLQHFGAGRCSWYPQNSATASTLASDKHFASRILQEAGVPALAANIFSCTTAIARIARRDTNAATRLPVSGHWVDRPSSSRWRDRAAISRKPFTARLRWLAISMTS